MKTAVLHIKSNLPSSAFCGFAELFASAKVIYIIGSKAAYKHSFLCNKFKFNSSRFGGLRELFTSFFNFHNNFIVSRSPKSQLSSYASYLRKCTAASGDFFDDYYFLFICKSRNALTHASSDTDFRRSLRVSGGFSAITLQQYNNSCSPRKLMKRTKAVYSGNGVPEISICCHPQGWSRSEHRETQSGSTPDRRSSANNFMSANRPTTAVGYDSNGVLSDMLITDAQHLAFQKFGRTAGFDSLPLLKAIVVNVGNLTVGKDRHFFKSTLCNRATARFSLEY